MRKPREILVISGKGGTGKTSISAAFAHLSGKDTVICDTDVDAPDLHLLLNSTGGETRHDFISGVLPAVDSNRCTGCGQCVALCRFGAISQEKNTVLIDPIRCEGCGLCAYICPAGAIGLKEKNCGWWQISQTRFAPMLHAQLHPGEENSGRLVALLKSEARKLAKETDAKTILADGPPGLGCPVISAISGVDLVVVVTEPSLSGIHDLERVLRLAEHFKVASTVIINRADLNEKVCQQSVEICRQKNIPISAVLPYDPDMVKAMLNGKTITEFSKGRLSELLTEAWEKISSKLL